MLEVELKFRAPDAARLIAQMHELGAGDLGTVEQTDEYFNHPQRDFAQTDEAVRVRSTNGRGAITYKGPLIDRETKTRREIEIELLGRDGEARMGELLRAIGFRPVLRVEKTRRQWSLRRQEREFVVALDQVQGLGEFVELETMADEAELPEARDALQRLARELNLENSERRGYLTLLLAQTGN